MLSRRHLLSILALSAAMLVPAQAFAAGKTPFSQKAFEAAQAAGRPILIDVSAPWCPTCRAQAPILSKLAAEPRFRNLAFFNVDFDSMKDVLRSLNVRSQSTLIVFRGRQEAGRSTGDTNPASIEALLAKAI